MEFLNYKQGSYRQIESGASTPIGEAWQDLTISQNRSGVRSGAGTVEGTVGIVNLSRLSAAPSSIGPILSLQAGTTFDQFVPNEKSETL